MTLFIFGGLFALLFYPPLKYLKGLWEKEEAPGWSTFVAGILLWLTVVSFGVMVYGYCKPIIGMFTAPQMSQGFELSFLTLGVAALAKLNVVQPEFLDLAHMMPFIRTTLLFENIAGKRLNLNEELDKFEIRRVHKEVTGKELQETKKPERRPQQTPEEIQKELEKLKQRKIITPHLEEELTALKNFDQVEITDSWKINCLRSTAHNLYEQVSRMRVAPRQRILSLDLNFGDIKPETLRESTGVFRLNQDIYEFLQALTTQDWMKPYMPYFDKIALTGSRTETDEFARMKTFLFISLEVRVAELRVRAEKFFNPAELPAIASIQFQNGDPIA